jgi:hypothetical protein
MTGTAHSQNNPTFIANRFLMARSPKLSGAEEVDAFMKQLDHPLKKSIENIRTLILGADKGITEQIKWKAPSFCFMGDDRITFNLHKNDCILLIFHRGAKAKDGVGKETLCKDSTGLLEWLSGDRAVVKFFSEAEVNEKKGKLLKIVKQWIKETID